MLDRAVRSLVVLNVSEGDAAPAPTDGSGWAWSSVLNRPVIYQGGAWRAVATIHVGTTAPLNPFIGQIWVDTN